MNRRRLGLAWLLLPLLLAACAGTEPAPTAAGPPRVRCPSGGARGAASWSSPRFLLFRCHSTRRWGRLINIASLVGPYGAPYVTAYPASKHALVGLTRALALEVAARGVTVNAICPGYVATDLVWSAAR